MLIALASIVAVLNVAKTVLGIGGIIFVHELGHFLVGRACRVKAEAFSIGFGPVLLKWQPGETEYRLSAIPLGGYVKFLGENPDERGERDPRSFHAATYPRKVAIMLAGVTMNVIAAFALFALTFSIGWEAKAPVVGSVVPGMPAWEYGLEKGDEVVEINGHRILDFTDIPQETAFVNDVDVVVRREKGGTLDTVRIPTRDRGEGLRQLGMFQAAVEDGRFAVADDEDPAGVSSGFRTGDRVVAVDGSPVTSFQDAKRVHDAAKKDTAWTVERDGEKLTVTLPFRIEEKRRLGVILSSRKIAVKQRSPAFAAGLRTGDAPLRVGSVETPTAHLFATALLDPANPGPLVVRRGAEEVSVDSREPTQRAALVQSIATLEEPREVWLNLPPGEGPGRAAGLPESCHALKIDGDTIQVKEEIAAAVAAAVLAKRSVTLVYADLAGAEHEAAITPAVMDRETDFGNLAALPAKRLVKEPNLFAAMGLGLNRTHRWIMRIVDTLTSIVSGRVSGRKLSGPIMIAKGTYAQAESSWGDFLLFLGMISMNLAVLNVLPVPLLDGGQLAVCTIERIRGRPLPERVLEGVQLAGIVLLLGLMAYVIRNDIANL